MSTLEVENLSIMYGDVMAVQEVSLTVPEGSVVALLGPNGAGKSSLARAIAGLVRPRSGRVLFGGTVLPAAPAAVVHRGISLVPEGRRIFPKLTVRENLLVGGYVQSRRNRQRLLDQMLTDFPILKARARQQAGSLSGGEQQVLAICRALMAEPSLIVIDEPSLGLAPIMIREVARVIMRLREEGRSVLLVEQNSQLALRLASHAYVLERGRVVEQGEAGALRKRDLVRKAYLGL